jgi:hypothetical protein
MFSFTSARVRPCSVRATAELTDCSHHTVARLVAARDDAKPFAELAYRV